jgi:transcriptional pleiotropic regulator of transition state genes
MKATGIVRSVDSLGRIVLPVELRRVLGIDTGDPLEIFTSDRYVVLGKYQPECIFCGSMTGVGEYKGARVCDVCLAKVKK